MDAKSEALKAAINTFCDLGIALGIDIDVEFVEQTDTHSTCIIKRQTIRTPRIKLVIG